MLIILFGGYLVQARADFVQGLVMMVGVTLLIVCIVRSQQVGGVQGLIEYAKSDSGLPKLNTNQWIALMATVLMTSFGTWGLPQMISKYFGIKDDKQAKRGIVISTFFAFLVAGGGYFIGSLCHRFFTVGKDMPENADYIVPSMLKASALPSILLGVIIVLLLSASVSTLCSVTLSASSAVSIDLIGQKVKKEMPEKKKGVLTKVFCVLFILLSYVVANTKTPILDMMSYSWGIISGSFLAPYLLALYYKKLNKISAWAGILTGFCIALVPATCKILNLCGNTDELVLKLMAQGPLYACIAMLCSLAMCIIVSLFTQKTTDSSVNEFFYNGVVENE
jgi:SSS family solute:Na+ symporter/sodium/proline symporter